MARSNGLVEAAKQSGQLNSLGGGQVFALGGFSGIANGAGEVAGTIRKVTNDPVGTFNAVTNLKQYKGLIKNADKLPGALVKSYQRRQRTANPYYRNDRIVDQSRYENFRRGYYVGVLWFEAAASVAGGQAKKLDKVQSLSKRVEKSRVGDALDYYRKAKGRVTGPPARVKSGIARRTIGKLDAPGRDAARAIIAESETVGRAWALSKRLQTVPSGFLGKRAPVGRLGSGRTCDSFPAGGERSTT